MDWIQSPKSVETRQWCLGSLTFIHPHQLTLNLQSSRVKRLWAMATVLGNEDLETSMMKESSIGTMATVTVRKMAPKLKAEPRKETL